MTSSRIFLLIATISGFFCIIFGAFGAHALKAQLSSESMAIWQTAVHYQMFQTLALLGLALLPVRELPVRELPNAKSRQHLRNIAGYLFILGLVLFSGSLYLLALTGITWLGAITPLGGVSFLVAWILLFFYVLLMKCEGE